MNLKGKSSEKSNSPHVRVKTIQRTSRVAKLWQTQNSTLLGVFSPWSYFYRPQRSWDKVIFSEACVKNSVHGRGGGMRGRGRAGVHGGGGHAQGGCVVGGHVWQGRVCMAGGHVCCGGCVCGGGHAWQEGHVWGACMARGMCGRGCMAGGACMPHTPPWKTLRPRHTVNERAVRILLECILVYTFSGIACYQLPPLSRGSCWNISSIESKLQSHMMAPGRITSSH